MDKKYITSIAAGSRLGTASAQNLGFYTAPTSESQNLELLAKSLVSTWG
jgi:hypothetical protein